MLLTENKTHVEELNCKIHNNHHALRTNDTGRPSYYTEYRIRKKYINVLTNE